MHKFQNPTFFLCIFYATVVLVKWRHGPHDHISEKGAIRKTGGEREGSGSRTRAEEGGR